ncbi:GNAT family N-acetyltransferase [Vibrio phage vB_VpP_HA7]|uniref:GNAT family N-acetyltransferase n=2 Tax=Maculvirus TaxID=2731958 RepID=A0A977LJ70_9CAUD|nr:GNAT family N-acetyltransferase [Vibrio phage vB_VpaP_GHSM17]UXF57371.1 GNAT family N-acetyltransferase [Vibrio phage vB_VpP_HA5]UXF57418.1 GNAT family N-acetyltransferase [Vibrio phage vB_VpP_HA7]
MSDYTLEFYTGRKAVLGARVVANLAYHNNPEFARGITSKDFRDSVADSVDGFMCMGIHHKGILIGGCAITAPYTTPHISGKGVGVVLSYVLPNHNIGHHMYRAIMRYAKAQRLDWVLIPHKQGEYEYRLKYYKVKHGIR